MIPIGLMLLAIDIPFLRRPVSRMISWCERRVVEMMALWATIRGRLRLNPNRDSGS